MSAQEHHHSSSAHHAGGHDHPEQPADETLAPDEAPTPMWLPVLGAVLFFAAVVWVAAF